MTHSQLPSDSGDAITASSWPVYPASFSVT